MKLNFAKSIVDFVAESRRVMGVSYKPSTQVFKRTLKVVLLGVIILGILGFVISEIISLIG